MCLLDPDQSTVKGTYRDGLCFDEPWLLNTNERGNRDVK